ncbi:E3 ubiquitin-protein ligase ubr1 [Saxophila tyrrhenica]|uniref:E3 ubiquitin-protein ligase n=1 Tax=Saxophila tyrrhenica TaxID=1690608 RepID=A0AAV9P731_9PEZI|nr:E3 ubiquitin-protein ligase ubr1 [Saxophila tyrrhenica]
MAPSPEEHFLLNELLEHPKRHAYRYTHAAACQLRQILFKSLAKQREDYLRLFFPNGPPTDQSQPWSLRDAQGAVDGAEYTTAAKGTACGHIFRTGESTYHCKTCAADDTCVLCARCFESSDHEGHAVFISVSPGNSGCCDCGDAEAWRREVKCTIHSAGAGLEEEEEQVRDKAKGKAPSGVVGRDLPDELVAAIRMTVSRASNYLCDVFSCSPEQLRLPKSEEGIRQDEQASRLRGMYHSSKENETDDKIEYALLLWNDEKHTVDEVQNQVARACKQSKKFGYEKAMEVDDVGRSIVYYSTDVPDLLQKAGILEQLKVTVTIRSSRDTFREQMCATITEWISDIAGCSVGSDSQVLRTIVCEELLSPWEAGSYASNKDVGREGIDDHEIDENERLRKSYRRMMEPLQLAANVRRVVMDQNGDIVEDLGPTVEADDDDDDEDEDQMDYDEEDEMDVELDDTDDLANAALAAAADADMDVEYPDDNEDMTEALEATIAGYPPPPPPPAASRRRQILTPTESEDGDHAEPAPSTSNEPYNVVPKTPKVKAGKQRSLRPSKHWLVKPSGFKGPRPSEPCENIWQRVRLDYLILYDLRLWKSLRINLRHLYITTVVTIPYFKRILGLRFAGLYTALAQLYLIADREPDHSIINLSIQMLTTPTITQEVVERGNFLTNLMAILYTFLTTRQVGFPEDISPRATLAFDAGAVTNRRMFHFFMDLKWLFQSELIHQRMRTEQHYLLQFLDLVKLHQGVCPNVRATGEHVEYESDAWISASMIVKEINRLCKQIAASYAPNAESDGNNTYLQRAMRTVAQVAMINSLGYERKRFSAAELKEDLTWHNVGPFEDSQKTYSVPKHEVQSEPMSFHHPLHYLLSWLIEGGKGFSREQVRRLLHFSTEDLKDPWNASRSAMVAGNLSSDDLLSAIFDHPLRVCVWLAQMKAGMWVRNGITLRHQAHTYRSVSHRDVGYQRDIFMVQAGLVLCGSDNERPGERFLAQMIDRFQMVSWFQGNYSLVPGFEESQQIDVLEDFFHLLIVALCERSNLSPDIDEKAQHARLLQHDIAHVLCFKPLSYSELTARLTEKVHDSDDFNSVLESMTTYRPPEGMNDTGTFELKSDFIELVDPYYAHYSRNHREEAESIYRKHIARKTGKSAEDVVYEPTLQPITSGLFANLSAFTSTPLFAQILTMALEYAACLKQHLTAQKTQLPVTRVETLLHMVLHLTLLATLEDAQHDREFIKLATASQDWSSRRQNSIVSVLIDLSSMEEYASCRPTIKHILRKMQLQQPEKLTQVIGPLGALLDRGDSSSPASVSQEDKERKKQDALARQARVMAQMKQQQNSFLENQGLSGFEDDIDDVDNMSITDEPESFEQKKTWSFPSGTCIWCQEETDDQRLYGTFAFLGESGILRSTPMEDLDYLKEVVDMPDSLDRPADHIRPFGVAGQNKRTVQKVGPDGKVVETERIGLSKGFPHDTHESKEPVATSCGHIMHYSCFELYMTHSNRRHAQQIARNHPDNIDKKEFICPLCKALGNTFLPIIWQAKECTPEHEMHTAKSFGDWLLEPKGAEHASVTAGPSISQSPSPSQEQLMDRFSQYVKNNLAPSMVSGMLELSIQASTPTAPTVQPQSSPSRHPLPRLPSGIGWPFRRSGSGSNHSANETPSLSRSPEPLPRIHELHKAYARMDDTIRLNRADSADFIGFSHRDSISTLSRSLGISISAFEIAQRGMSSDPFATSLLAEMPEQAVTHFRIMSETVESYMAVTVLRSTPTLVAPEVEKKRAAVMRLLYGADEIPGARPFFEDDMFLFFVDWLSFMAPDVAAASSVLQMCLWAEVVKAMFVLRTKLKEEHLETAKKQDTSSARVLGHFEVIAQSLDAEDKSNPNSLPSLTPEQTALLRRMVDKYALAFLRKAIIIMHIRYGLDFDCPYNIDPETPELHRLTKLLHMPSIDEMAELFCGKSAAGDRLRHISYRWAYQARNVGVRDWITMPHPAIFELVGLPKTYDTLTEEAIRRKCPTTGKEITDPAVCLMCGDIFCSQATCCATEKRYGGCYQHMAKCGGKIGLFINVRKCMVLFMHGPGNGSWIQAPYLDKHGEPDPTLRRHHQLFLNQRRYDKLMREAWLLHQIPTVISRKLEADINPGGWETL